MYRNYWLRRARSPFSRRRMLQGSAAMGVGAGSLAFVGCGNDDDDDAPANGNGNGNGAPEATRDPGDIERQGIINFAHTADADHLDPHLDTAWTMVVAPHTHAKLLRWSPDISEILPDLAEGLPEMNDDGLEYTFTLRPDLQWPDGSPLTSADIAYSYNRIAGEELGSPHRYKAGPLAGIDTPDDRTVVFRLEEPFVPFVSFAATGWMIILPEGWADDHGDRFQDSMGAGPYMIDQRQSTVSTQYVPNPNYYDGERPFVEGMDFRIIPDASTMDAALISGDIDVIPALTDRGRVDNILNSNPDIEDIEHPSHHWNMFIMNCEEGREPFDDVRVRRAMNLLIDRELYQAIVHSTGGQPSGPVTWGFEQYAIPQDDLVQRPGYRPDKEEDIQEAMDLLSAAGYEDGLQLDCATTTPAAHATYNAGALAIQDQLAEYGIELVLGTTDMAGIQEKRADGNFDCMVYVNGGSQEIDEHIYGPNRTGEARNVNRFSNAELDEMLDRQRVTLDEEERTELIMEIQEKLLEEVPTAWLADPFYHSLVNRRLRGYNPYLVWDRSSEFIDAYIEE